MKKYNFNKAIKDTQKVISEMPGKQWNAHIRFVELIEEIGELANAIQTEEGYKSKKRKKSDLTDSICDALFEILAIAGKYKIDLDKEYPLVLREIERRRRDGEFDLK